MAMVTSTFGTILKIDSTKKVCKKLRGSSAGSAGWATNIGNERGEILQCASEGIADLQQVADCLMDRYEKGGQPAPIHLYTDRDCCSQQGSCDYSTRRETK